MGESYLEGSIPVSTPADPQLVATGAADSGSEEAAQTIYAARRSGLSPGYVQPREDFQDNLEMSPAVAQWAAQSAQHAAAVRPDAPVLARMEDWIRKTVRGGVTSLVQRGGLPGAVTMGFVDLAHGEAMREYMNGGTGWGARSALNLEALSRAYDAQDRGILPSIARAAPQMAAYSAVGYLTGGVGVAALMYAQNKGTLARQIQLAAPDLSDNEVNQYAQAGSLAGAVTLAGLMGPMLRSMPGTREGLQSVVSGALARGAATTVGRAALNSLAKYGIHTLSGALGMALQAVINKGTVQKASTGDVDYMQLGREGAETFLKVLPVAAAYSSYGPFRDFMEDRGRIMAATSDSSKMSKMLADAKEVQLSKHSPDLAAELFGALMPGARAYISAAAARKMAVPDSTVAAAEASQGDVAMPLGDLLAHGPDVPAEEVKLDQDGMTPAEAVKRDKEMRQALSPEEARALYGSMPADEMQGLDLPPIGDADKGLVDRLSKSFEGQDKNSPTTPARPGNKTEVAKPLHEVMAEEYGGTPEKWAQILTPELMEALNQEGSVGAISPEEHAARVIEATPVGDINPKPFERIAAKAQKYIQKRAEHAVTGGPAGAKATSLKDVANLSTYELARDLNLAKAKKASEVKAELEDLKSSIAKRAVDQKLRANLRLAGTPLLNLFDALTEATSVSPQRQGWVAAHQDAVEQGAAPMSKEATQYADGRMQHAVDVAVQWFKDNAYPFKFDEGALDRLVQKPQPWDSLLPAEARNVGDALKQLTTIASKERTIRVGDRDATVEETAQKSIEELGQNPDKGLPKQSGIKETIGERFLKGANDANALILWAKNNIRWMSATLQKATFDRINAAMYYRDELFRTYGDPLDAAFKSIPADIAKRRYESYDLSKELPVEGTQPMQQVPRLWLWKLALHRMSGGNMERVASTSGWDRDTLDGLLFDRPDTKLTVPEWDYLQSIADNFERVWKEKMRPHFEENYGMAPPKTGGVPFRVQLEDGTWKDYAGGYHPLKRDARPGVAPQAEPTKGIAQYWGRDFQIPWTPGSARERVDNSHYLVNMSWDSTMSTLAQTLHWLAYDQPVRDVGRLLNDQDLRAEMNQRMGEGRASMVDSWLGAVATRGAASVPKGVDSIVTAGFGWQRRLALMQIVGGSVRLGVQALSHPIGLMVRGKINPLAGSAAILSVLKPFETANGEVRVFPEWLDAMQEYDQVAHRADNAYGQLRQKWSDVGLAGDRNPASAALDIAKRTAGLFLHAADRITTTWAALAAENEAIGLKMEPGTQSFKDYVNSKVQDVMPAHDIEVMAPALSNRTVGGFIIMHGFKNTLYQFRQEAIHSSRQDFYQAQSAADYGGAIARTAGRAALEMAMLASFAVLGKLTLGFGQQSDETKGQWLGRTMLGGQGDDLPLFGGLGEPMAKWFLGGKVSKRDFETYSDPGLAWVNKTYEMAGDWMAGTRPMDKKLFDSVEYLLFSMGAPSRAPRRMAEAAFQHLTGTDYDEFESNSAAHLFYSEKQWDSIRRTLSPDPLE